jgi:hypothetical protein
MSGSVDDLAESLGRVLSDVYDYVNEQATAGPLQDLPPLHEKLAEHALYPALLRAVAKDKSMTKFFPALRDAPDRSDDIDFVKQLQSVVVWSNSSSEGVTPLAVCSAVIGDVFKFLWSFSDTPSLEEILRRLPRSLKLVRDLAERRVVQVPALTLIHNIGLVDNDPVEIGPATLRRPTRYDKSRLLLNFMAPNVEDVVVLRVDTSFSVLDIRPISRGSDPDGERRITQRLLEERGYPSQEKEAWLLQNSIDRARTAIILASRKGNVFAPIQSWQSVVRPFGDLSRAAVSNARMQVAPYPSQMIDDEVRAEIESWAPLVERYSEVLRGGARRLLLAVTERMYPEDGFIDAIISWESLFSASPETTLRVCGAMAKLLEPENQTRRLDCYRILNGLYRRRSSVVHGSFSYSSRVTAEERDRAVELALDAFRSIYRREDLLGIADSAERGRLLLLE